MMGGEAARQAWLRVAAAISASLAFLPTASADESRGYYFGGLLGVGFGQFASGGDAFSSFLPLGANRPSSSGPVGDAAPSLSLVFGKNWPVGNAISAGLELEETYQEARGRTSGTAHFVTAPFFGGETTETDQATSQWSVPAQAALRARVAFQVSPNVSVYGSPGPALGYAHIHTIFSENVSGFCLNRQNFQVTQFNNSQGSSGGRWVVDPGVSFSTGIEVALSTDISLRGEYSLAAMQTISQTVSDAGTSNSVAAEASPVFQGIRLGLVRHF